MLLFLLITLLVAAVDLLIKQQVERKPTDFFPHACLGGHIRIRRLHNHGLMLGWLKKSKLLPKLVPCLALVVFLVVALPLLREQNSALMAVAFGLLAGGALGNLADRLLRGYVVDYLSFGKGGQSRFGSLAFNLADFAIIAALPLLLLMLV